MIIIVSGSGGSGKSTIARALARKLNFRYIDVNKLINDNELKGVYIKKFNSYEVDINKLNNVLIGLIKKDKNLILDSHLSHYLPSKYVDYCVICKCDLRVLSKRLKKRKYAYIKIRENLDSEIFDVCLVEALENRHNVIVADTSKKSVMVCIKQILERVKLY